MGMRVRSTPIIWPCMVIHNRGTDTVQCSLHVVIKARVAAGGRIRTDNKLNGTGVFDKYGEVITGPRARQDLITLCQA